MLYREMQQVVDAVLFTGNNIDEVGSVLQVSVKRYEANEKYVSIEQNLEGLGSCWIYAAPNSWIYKTKSGIVVTVDKFYFEDKFEPAPESDEKILGPARAMDSAQGFQNFVSDSFGSEECKIRMDCVRIASACGYTRADAIKEAAKELYLFVLSGR